MTPGAANPAGVLQAVQRLFGRVVRTPLLESPLLNAEVCARRGVSGVRVFVKAECLQHTGAFKYRGALHKLLCMGPAREGGVVAFSSGNFAQALALAARDTGTRCTIVAPHDAPAIKMQRTRQYGAQVVLSTADPDQNREVAAARLAQQLATRTGAALLHPFDDHEVIYGQGTLAVEAFEQLQQQADGKFSRLVVPTGGGGMAAGCCLARQALQPGAEVWAVEPEGYEDHAASLLAGACTPLAGPPAHTICDALQANAPGRLTFAVNGAGLGLGLAGAVAAPDEAVLEAMKIAFDSLKLVLEPSGALGLAAVLSGAVPVHSGENIGVVACGGNVSLADFMAMLQSNQAHPVGVGSSTVK